jgi:hypothetical protein
MTELERDLWSFIENLAGTGTPECTAQFFALRERVRQSPADDPSDIISELLEWEQHMGGWDAAPWARAKAFMEDEPAEPIGAIMPDAGRA